MKKLLLLLALITVFCLLTTRATSAHELQTDGNIGAILHIEPDDDPVTGQPQTFILYFQALTNNFKLSNCICHLELKQGSKTIYSQALIETSNNVSENPYTFTKDGLYTLSIIGSPKQLGEFSNFRLNYQIRTEKGSGDENNKKLSVYTIIGLVLLQLLALLALYNFLRP